MSVDDRSIIVVVELGSDPSGERPAAQPPAERSGLIVTMVIRWFPQVLRPRVAPGAQGFGEVWQARAVRREEEDRTAREGVRPDRRSRQGCGPPRCAGRRGVRTWPHRRQRCPTARRSRRGTAPQSSSMILPRHRDRAAHLAGDEDAFDGKVPLRVHAGLLSGVAEVQRIGRARPKPRSVGTPLG